MLREIAHYILMGPFIILTGKIPGIPWSYQLTTFQILFLINFGALDVKEWHFNNKSSLISTFNHNHSNTFPTKEQH